MTNTDTITIDGQAYDAVTGLPVSKDHATKVSAPVAHAPSHHSPAAKLHGGPQHSVTLRRSAVKKPVPQKHAIVGHSGVKHMDIARPRHASVTRFAPHPAGALHPRPAAPKSMDIGPVTHPHVARAHAQSAAKSHSPAHTPAAVIKNEALKTAIEKTHKDKPLKTRFRSRQRVIAVLSAALAIVLLGGYLTYLNMPALSVRVAAAQAGIDANYPSYRPDGYALNGPVTYSSGKVAMNFKANGGNQSFTINQSKSNWDSTALLDDYVSPRAGSDYIPYTENGLTIYTYGDNAAWVNGGILYTIEGNAPLSSTQMRQIATSLL